MDIRSTDKGIAVVTGASSGLGWVYADRLAKRGYDLLLTARRGDRLEALSAEIRAKYAVNVETQVADLSNGADIEKIAQRLSTDQRISVLINNAGTATLAPSENISYAQVESIFKVNAESLTRLSLAVLPGFKERNNGTLVNIGSVLSFYALPISTTYSATKAYVMLFTLGLQQELAGTGVRVQLLLPAATATEIWDVGGVGLSNLDPAIVMSTENCVDAALAGLDQGETVTLPSLEDANLWKAFDEARTKMFMAAQTKNVASRYGLAS